jgi:hypothetical protein
MKPLVQPDSPFVTRPESTYKSGIVVQTTGATSFLTWFEFAPAHAGEFDQLLVALRGSEEWRYIEREVEIRLVRDGA